MTVELMNCEKTLLDEIDCRATTRDDVALTYAMTLCSSERDQVDWKKVNRAIASRWSFYAVDYIKRRAHKLVEEKR